MAWANRESPSLSGLARREADAAYAAAKLGALS